MAGPNRWGRGTYAMPNDNTTVYNQRTEVLPEIVDSRQQRILNTINEAKAKKGYRIRSGQNPYANSQEVFDAWKTPDAQQMWDDFRFQKEEEEYKRQRDQELQNEILYDTDILDQNTRNINYTNNQFTASQQVPAYMRYANPKDVDRVIYGNSPLASGIKGAYNATIGTLTDPEYGVSATYDKIRDGKLDAWGAARNIGLNLLALSPFMGGLNLSSAKGAGTAINEAGNTATRALNTAATLGNKVATNVRNTAATLGNKASQMLYGSPQLQLAMPGGYTVSEAIATPIARTIATPISLDYPLINGITKTLSTAVSNAPYSVVANGLYNNARVMADEAPAANESATSETSEVGKSQENPAQPAPEQPQQNPEPEQPAPKQPQESPNQPQQNPNQPTPEEKAAWEQVKELDSYNALVDFARDNPNSPYFKQAVALIKDKNPKGFLGIPKRLPDFIRKYESARNKVNNTSAIPTVNYPAWKGGDWRARSVPEFLQNYVNPFHKGTLMKHLYLTVPESIIDRRLNKAGYISGPFTQNLNYFPLLSNLIFGGEETDYNPFEIYGFGNSSTSTTPKDTTKSIIHEPVVTREDSSEMQTNSFNTDMNNSSQYLDTEDLELTKKIGNGNNN